jgi:serine/threonine-protein kinase HipA
VRSGSRQRARPTGSLGDPVRSSWLGDDPVAERLREPREDSTAWLGRSFTGQFSLAGAQAKTALVFQDGPWGVPSGSTPTTHILKPAVTGLDDHDLNEHLCLDAARRAGLLVARTRVAQFGGETAVVVTRYDRRVVAGGEILRVHQEDLCQALGVPPNRKYQNEGGPGPGEIARLLRNAMPHAIAEESLSRFADALIWNLVIGGTDAHAKNYSVLLAGDQVRLAPVYDVASALPYGVHERKLRFAMKIGGDDRVALGRNTWPTAARELGVDSNAIVDRARELASRAPDAFAGAASAPGVVALHRALPSKLLDLVADRAAVCLKLLESAS